MFTKKWYKSKTIWANLVAILAVAVQMQTGTDLITPEVQIGILGIINLIFRSITSDSVEW